MSQHLSLPKDKIRFLLLEGVHQNAIDVLNAAGYTNIDYRKTALEGDALKEAVKDAHFIGIRSRTQLTEEVFEAANKLIYQLLVLQRLVLYLKVARILRKDSCNVTIFRQQNIRLLTGQILRKV